MPLSLLAWLISSGLSAQPVEAQPVEAQSVEAQPVEAETSAPAATAAEMEAAAAAEPGPSRVLPPVAGHPPPFPEAPQEPPAEAPAPGSSRSAPTPAGVVLAALAAFAVLVAAWALWVALSRREHRRLHCKKCGGRLVVLGKEALSPGQRMEEHLGAVRYQLRECRRCEVIYRSRRHSFLLGRDPCQGCGFHTRQRRRLIRRAATYQRAGIRRTEISCAYCDHSLSYDEALPQLERSDSE